VRWRNFLYRVLNWNFDWLKVKFKKIYFRISVNLVLHVLQEQRGYPIDKPPPILEASTKNPTSQIGIPKLKLQNVKPSYNNYSSYTEVYHSFIYHETWAKISKEMDQNPQQPTSKFRVPKTPIFKDGFALFELPSRDIGRMFNMDLVAVTFIEEKASASRTVFGVVKDNFNVFLHLQRSSLEVWIKEGNFPKFPFDCTVKKILPFGPIMKQLLLVADLETSWLGDVILRSNPCNQAFKLKKIDVKNNRTHLNASQYEAVESITSTILEQPNETKLALLHGPPGNST
jgi:hypothetical protein